MILMKRFTLVLIIALLQSCIVLNDDGVGKAQQLFDQGKYSAALAALDQVSSFRKSKDAKFLEAKIHTKLKSHSTAIDVLENLKGTRFKQDTVNFLIGRNYFLDDTENYSGKLNRAISAADEAININSEYFEAYKLKSKALHNLSRHEENILLLDRVTQIFPDRIEIKLFRTIAKYGLTDYTSVERETSDFIKTCSKIDSSNLGLAYRFRGLAFYERCHDSRGSKADSLSKLAIESFTESLLYDGNNKMTYFNRGLAYKRSDGSKACDDFRKSADLGYMLAYDHIKSDCKYK